MHLTGLNDLQALGKSIVKDYRNLKKQAAEADQQPKDKDVLPDRVDFISRDGSHIQADLHRQKEYARVSVSKDAPEAGIQSSSISYEQRHSDLDVTMLNINDDKTEHRSQVNMTVNMRTGVITDFTRSEWNPQDIP